MKTRRRDIRALRLEAQRHQYDAMLDDAMLDEAPDEGDDEEHDGYQPVRERSTTNDEGATEWPST